MTPDGPVICPTCGAPISHESEQFRALRLTARVFECGGAVCIADGGRLYPALACPKSHSVIAELRAEVSRLRADNVRLGDRNVLQAIAILAAIEGIEKSLRAYAALPLDTLPTVALLELAPLRAAYDELVDALEGQPSAPAVEAAPVAPDHGLAGVEQTSAAEHEIERSLDTP